LFQEDLATPSLEERVESYFLQTTCLENARWQHCEVSQLCQVLRFTQKEKTNHSSWPMKLCYSPEMLSKKPHYSMLRKVPLLRLEALKHAQMQEETVVEDDFHNGYKICIMIHCFSIFIHKDLLKKED